MIRRINFLTTSCCCAAQLGEAPSWATRCLLYELHKRGLRARAQVELPVVYDQVKIDVGYRVDLLVEEAVIVELKAVESVLPLHEAQLLAYLKLSGWVAGAPVCLDRVYAF